MFCDAGMDKDLSKVAVDGAIVATWKKIQNLDDADNSGPYILSGEEIADAQEQLRRFQIFFRSRSRG